MGSRPGEFVSTIENQGKPFAGDPSLPRLRRIDSPREFANSIHCYRNPVMEETDLPVLANEIEVR
jgi:hypothetical protein